MRPFARLAMAREVVVALVNERFVPEIAVVEAYGNVEAIVVEVATKLLAVCTPKFTNAPVNMPLPLTAKVAPGVEVPTPTRPVLVMTKKVLVA